MAMVDADDPSSRKPPYKVQWDEKPRVLVYGEGVRAPASGCVGKSQQVTVSDPTDKIQSGAHGPALSSLPLVNPPIHSTTAPVSIKR
jgi:hypothetical protein